MNSTQIYAKLVDLRNEAGPRLYERLKLASELLTDKGWIHAEEGGGGDESVALDRLELDCFGDICGALTLSQMLEILHTFPDVKAWKTNKFNLRKMWMEMKEKTKAKPHRVQEYSRGAGGDGASLEDRQKQAMVDLRTENQELRRQLQISQREISRLKKILSSFIKEAEEVLT